MSYHPIIGIMIFLAAIVVSFYFGRLLLKKSQKRKLFSIKYKLNNLEKPPVPKGEVTSPDAPWLKDN